MSSQALEREREGQEGEARSVVNATLSLGESTGSQLPVAGPYDFGALKSSLLRADSLMMINTQFLRI